MPSSLHDIMNKKQAGHAKGRRHWTILAQFYLQSDSVFLNLLDTKHTGQFCRLGTIDTPPTPHRNIRGKCFK